MRPCSDSWADPVDAAAVANRKLGFPLEVIGNGKVIVLPSAHPASLQFYAHAANDNVFELEIAPSNRVSRSDERPIQPARVEHVAVTDGWMATVDTWSAEGFTHETYLKLWRTDAAQLSFTIDTRVDRPHGSARLLSIAFTSRTAPTPLLVTVANEPDLKIWAYVRGKSSSGKPIGPSHAPSDVSDHAGSWRCRSSFSHRGLVPRHAAWSEDGSLLAVAYAHSVALWDVETMTLLHLFGAAALGQASVVRFCGAEGSTLICTGAKGTLAWDIGSCTGACSHV